MFGPKGSIFQGMQLFLNIPISRGLSKTRKRSTNNTIYKDHGNSKGNPNTLLKCEDQVVISNCIIFDCGER